MQWIESRFLEGDLQGRRVAVVGLGYVGLPTALSLADHGAEIIGCDVSESRLADIKSGRVDLHDHDRSRLTRHLRREFIRLTTEPAAIADAEGVLVCVPTPIDAHQNPDLTALSAACDSVVRYATAGQTIVLTSTTYVGCTHDLLVRPLEERGFDVGNEVFVAFSPERIDPGVVEHSPERTPRVVGGYTPACRDRAARFLAHTAASMHMVSSPEAAEMTKLLENTFRAVNIALANEFADAARELKVNVMEVIEAAATKPYGFMPFYPGPGVGGHCIPCDPHYLLWQLRARRAPARLVQAAMTEIVSRPREVVARARQLLGDCSISTIGARVLLLGVTYKPGIADLRESPALEILDGLAEAGAHVAYADPFVPFVKTRHAGTLTSETHASDTKWDLVIVHTTHPSDDYAWLADHTVLDTTYRLTNVIGCHAL